jgi:hypothetical protein
VRVNGDIGILGVLPDHRRVIREDNENHRQIVTSPFTSTPSRGWASPGLFRMRSDGGQRMTRELAHDTGQLHPANDRLRDDRDQAQTVRF